jgi:hypothetical protein
MCAAFGQVLALEALQGQLPPRGAVHFLRSSLMLCAHVALLCACCQLKCVGHALTKPQPYQHFLAKLPFFWTVDIPA